MSPEVANTPDLMGSFLLKIFERLDNDRENFVVLTLTAKMQILGHKVVSIGGTTSCNIDLKTLFRDVFSMGGAVAGFAIAHNHPSGDVTPSTEDIKLSKSVDNAAKMLGFNGLTDSFVISNDKYTSMFEKNLF